MSFRSLSLLCLIVSTWACGSKTDSSPGPGPEDGGDSSGEGGGDAGGVVNRAGSAASAGKAGKPSTGGGGSSSMTGGGGGGGGDYGGSGPTACLNLGSECAYASECCTGFCSEETHRCRVTEFCPVTCGPNQFCRPSFDESDNLCLPSPKPQCPEDSLQGPCNRCIVENCPAEVVFCGCTDECFDIHGGCLPTCGGTDFTGFSECIERRCGDACF